MIRLFIGWDDRESISYHVLSHSILKRASCPVSITPLNRQNLIGAYERPRGDMESTDFSISRFIVPYLCNYDGYAVFMDCDMLCLGDIAELARYMTLHTRWTQAVHVAKHDYTPKEEKKFLGEIQTRYEKKNWSSVMVFNNALCRNLTPEFVNTAPGLALHQFKWTTEDKIGGLPKTWNYLVGEENQEPNPRLIHFTKGGPWFREFANCEYADAWRAELNSVFSMKAAA